jgi:hypothetical protein
MVLAIFCFQQNANQNLRQLALPRALQLHEHDLAL